MINDTSLPIIFVGTNVAIWHWKDTCEALGYTVTGIVDDDYVGQGQYQDIPVIGTEQDIIDGKFSGHQFFCTTFWQPDYTTEPWNARNRQKRQRIIAMLDSLNVPIASIVHPNAFLIHRSSIKIGHGVFIDMFARVGPNTTIGNWTSILHQSGIAHDSTIGQNVVMQFQSILSGGVTLGDNVYLSPCSCVMRDNVVVAPGTFVHPHILLLRGTAENEVVGLEGKDLRKVYSHPIVK